MQRRYCRARRVARAVQVGHGRVDIRRFHGTQIQRHYHVGGEVTFVALTHHEAHGVIARAFHRRVVRRRDADHRRIAAIITWVRIGRITTVFIVDGRVRTARAQRRIRFTCAQRHAHAQAFIAFEDRVVHRRDHKLWRITAVGRDRDVQARLQRRYCRARRVARAVQVGHGRVDIRRFHGTQIQRHYHVGGEVTFVALTHHEAHGVIARAFHRRVVRRRDADHRRIAAIITWVRIGRITTVFIVDGRVRTARAQRRIRFTCAQRHAHAQAFIAFEDRVVHRRDHKLWRITAVGRDRDVQARLQRRYCRARRVARAVQVGHGRVDIRRFHGTQIQRHYHVGGEVTFVALTHHEAHGVIARAFHRRVVRRRDADHRRIAAIITWVRIGRITTVFIVDGRVRTARAQRRIRFTCAQRHAHAQAFIAFEDRVVHRRDHKLWRITAVGRDRDVQARLQRRYCRARRVARAVQVGHGRVDIRRFHGTQIQRHYHVGGEVTFVALTHHEAHGVIARAFHRRVVRRRDADHRRIAAIITWVRIGRITTVFIVDGRVRTARAQRRIRFTCAQRHAHAQAFIAFEDRVVHRRDHKLWRITAVGRDRDVQARLQRRYCRARRVARAVQVGHGRVDIRRFHGTQIQRHYHVGGEVTFVALTHHEAHGVIARAFHRRVVRRRDADYRNVVIIICTRIIPIRTTTVICDGTDSGNITSHKFGTTVQLKGFTTFINRITSSWYAYGKSRLTSWYCITAITILTDDITTAVTHNYCGTYITRFRSAVYRCVKSNIIRSN
ncbi:hypothetical protein R50073_32170 [Maricurvus nonylphenolicus]